MLKPSCALILALALCGPTLAGAPSTLGYQGRLATAGGQPISATLNITFRLYDVPTGGSELWSETQSNVSVDGGNLAVELGKVTALPASIWGRQLYLGVQVQGDSEMLPRPPLTAAPYALRAKSTLKNTIFVPAEGTAVENGAALAAAVASAAGASAATPIAIELDAGTYDLGVTTLIVPGYVTLGGRGQEATRIATGGTIAVQMLGNASAHDFTATATGTPADASGFTIGVAVVDPAFNATTVPNVRLRNVTGIATGAPGSTGARWGIYFCGTDSRAERVTGIGQGGQFTVGFRADCKNGNNNIVEHVVANASGSSTGIRGAYLAGSGIVWRDFKVFVATNPGAQSTYGIGIFVANVDTGSLLSNAVVNIDGGGVNQTVNGIMDGILVLEGANVDLERVTVKLDDARKTSAVGLYIDSPPGSHVVRVTDADIAVSGVQVPQNNFAQIIGIWADGAAAQIARAKVVVRCLPGGTYECAGVERRVGPGGLQDGVLTLDQLDVTAGNEGAADATAFDEAYFGEAARISNSSLRVLRGPTGEGHSVVNANNGVNVRIADSTLIVESTVTPTSDCVIGGGGAIELYSSHVQGQTCVTGPAPTCAGNTKVGTGFLASTCP